MSQQSDEDSRVPSDEVSPGSAPDEEEEVFFDHRGFFLLPFQRIPRRLLDLERTRLPLERVALESWIRVLKGEIP